MSPTNKFGLSRDIPDPVKRAVRQRCGFGCVVCGAAVCQYEHVDPTYADAREHDPNAMALLCGGCHDRVTRGLLSKESLKLANAAPRARQDGFSFGPFDIGREPPDVRLGSFRAVRPRVVLRVFGDNVFQVAPPEVPNGPFRISATFANRSGRTIFRIQDNIWQTPGANWDTEVVGPRITVRAGPGELELRLRVEPPRELVVERLAMYYRGARLTCEDGGEFTVQAPGGAFFRAQAATVVDCEAALDVQDEGIAIGYLCKGPTRIGMGQFGSRPPRDLPRL